MSEGSELVAIRAFSATWLLSNAVGSIKVVVPSDDVAAARAVLDTPAAVQGSSGVDLADAQTTADSAGCPRCGGRSVVPDSR
jgi:hypothetical protein